MADLLCALCLLGVQPLRAQPALTIANGHAVCEAHFRATALQQTSNGSGAALGLLYDARRDARPRE